MKKVISWVASSFFRQAGRFLFYIVLGGMIFLLFKANDFKLNFADILLPMHVKASTLTTPVEYAGQFTLHVREQDTSKFDTYGEGYSSWVNSSSSSTISQINFYRREPYEYDTSQNDYMAINIMLSTGIINENNNQETSYISCTTWRQVATGDYECESWTETTNGGNNFLALNGLQMSIKVVYSNGEQESCEIHESTAYCNVRKRQLTRISVNIIQPLNNMRSYFYIKRQILMYNTINTAQSIIDNQNQNTNQTLNFFSDTNTTSSSDTTSNFFSETNSTSESALTSIVSAPLTLINSLVVGTHDSICATLNSKQICLPSGDIIWNRATSSQNHGGSGVHDHWFRGGSVEQFIAFFNLVVGGFILYKCLLSIFNMVHKLLDPANSWVGVMKL